MARKAIGSDEFSIIARHFAPLAKSQPLAFGLKDDAAVIRPKKGQDLVVTTDAVVAGVHFLPDDPPADIARKLLRVNLSDLAAKGATPRAYVMTTAFPKTIDEAWLKAFASGLAADQAKFDVVLLGGDTVATNGPLTLSLTAFGEVARGRMLLRAGARPGDEIWVSGTIGDAGLGLRVLKNEDLELGRSLSDWVTRRYRAPEPRTELGPRLVGHARACLDISDGLIADLGHICEVSGVGIELAAEAVPLSGAAHRALQAGRATLEELLTAGDDYELAFAITPVRARKLGSVAEASGTKLTKIGHVTRGKQVVVRGTDGQPLQFAHRGYTHF